VAGTGRSSTQAWGGDGGLRARRMARLGTGIAVLVFVLLATSGRPWHLFDRGPFSSDFYDAQARALSRGHLDVPPAVAGIEGFVVRGRTQFYYGIVPALARVPVSAATQALDGRLVLLSLTAALAVACLAGARLLQRARDAVGVAVPARWWPWLTGGFAVTIGLSTPLLWLSSRALVYHEAELWGAALAVLGFERVVAWWSSRSRRDLVWASVVASLALSTRGSSGIGPVLALGALAGVVAWRRAWRDAALVVLAAVVPVALYAAVNLLRFGSLFAVPFDKQVLDSFSATRRAALAANHDTLFGLKFLPSAIVQYLRPDTVTPRALAPWLGWGRRADVLGDVTFDTVDRSASLPVTAPAYVVAGVIGAVAMVRRRLPASWPVVLVAALASVVPTLTIAFIAQRYLADFVPVLVVAAAVGVPVFAGWAAARVARRWVVGAVAAALVVAGFSVNAGLAVLARNIYLLPTTGERRDFVAAQYSIDDALGGGRPPGVIAVATLGAPASDGTVAIVGDCDGLYRSDGDAWVLLEQRAGGTQRVVVDGSAAGPVASGDGWQITLEADAGGRRLVYTGRARVEGRPISRRGPIEVDVRTDPTIPMVTADVDGQRALDAFLQPADGPVVAPAGWTSRPVAAPLCASLERRLR
jgi:hypothetical protein